MPNPPRVLVLTTFENDDYVFDAMRAGAAGFLLKRARPEQILHAIRVVAGGELVLFPAAIAQLTSSRPSDTRLVHAVATLTERETEVLRLIARGLSNVEIASELAVSLQTVKTHVVAVLAKLDVRDRTQAAIAAYESRLVEPG